MKVSDRTPWLARQRSVCGVPVSGREFVLLVGGWALFALIIIVSLPPVLRAALSVWGRFA